MTDTSTGFEYDLFISYGWAGNVSPEEGDRRWVSQMLDHMLEPLRTRLGKNPRVYIDRDGTQAGFLDDRLSSAVDSSALLLFVVSPGSCRPDSWCHREAARFWDHNARPLVSDSRRVLAPEDRIVKIVMSPVDSNLELPFMSPITGRPFFDALPIGSAGPIPQPVDWGNLSPAMEAEFQRLISDIAARLKDVSGLEGKERSGKRVFLGACSTELNRERFRRLRRELLLDGHPVTSASPLPREKETDFRLRTEAALHGTQLAVFAVEEATPAPEGWKASRTALQLETAFGLSAADLDFSVFAWGDPTVANLDEECIARVKPNRRDQFIQGGKAFEYLESNVRARLQISAEPLSVGLEGGGKRVCVGQIMDALRGRQIQAQPAIPTPAKGTLTNRIIKKNQTRYYKEADGLVVCFGEGDYEWVSDVCYAMKEFLQSPPDFVPDQIRRVVETSRSVQASDTHPRLPD